MKTSLVVFFLIPFSLFGQIKIESLGSQRANAFGGEVHMYLSVQAETSAWQAAVRANGGTCSAVDIRAVDFFVRETKLKGIWPLLDWIALFAGRNFYSALVQD